MGRNVLLTDENQTQVVGDLLAVDLPKGPWRVQRPDGQYFSGVSGGGTGVACFTPHAAYAAAWSTEAGAQHFIDIHQGSAKSRMEFYGCTPAHVGPEPGEHNVCACGQIHERDYCCPTAAGHGVIL